MSELKPCPFCGSKAELVTESPKLPNGEYDTLFHVKCTLRECGNRTSSWYPDTAAMRVWNTRAESPITAEMLREALLAIGIIPDDLWLDPEFIMSQITDRLNEIINGNP